MSSKSTLYVSGLDVNLVETALREEFTKHANIERVTVIRDKKTRVSKGFAYILCKTDEDAGKAKNAMDGQFMLGQKITVKYSNSETPDWLTVLKNRGALTEESAPSVPRVRGGMPMRGPGRGFRGTPGRGGPGMRGSRGSPHGAPRVRGAGRPNGHFESPRGRGGARDGWRGREGPPQMRGHGGAPRGRGGAPPRDRGYLGYDDDGYDVEPRGRRGPPEGRSRPAMSRDEIEQPPGRRYGGIDSDRNGLEQYDAQPARQAPPRAFQNRYDDFPPTEDAYAPREPVRHMQQRRPEPEADFPPARPAYRERSPMGRDNYHTMHDPYAQEPVEDQYRQAGPMASRPDQYAAPSRLEVNKRPDPYAMKPSYSGDSYGNDPYAIPPAREPVRGRPTRGRPTTMIPRRGGYGGDMY